MLSLSMPRVVKLTMALVLGSAAGARAMQTDYAQVRGTVTVWIVSPASAEEKARIALRQLAAARTLPTTVQESTTGDFGQPSSTIGQTAGSYGQTAGSLGGPASGTGQTAGSYGQTAGSLGTVSGDVGQTAGSYGQTSGSYGQAAGSYGQTSSTYGEGLSDPSVTRGSRGRDEVTQSKSAMHGILEGISRLRPGVQARLVDVSSEGLRDSLLGARGTDAFPDVVVGVLPAWWDGSGWGLAMLGSLRFLDVERTEVAWRLGRQARVVVLRYAPHPVEARAYVLGLREGDLVREPAEPRRKELQAAVGVAVSAFDRVLGGGGLAGDADEAAARFSGELAQRMALTPVSEAALNGLESQVDVLEAGANQRLAVVSVRAVLSSDAAFGSVRAVVVLRKDEQGHWRVLQISPGVPPARMGSSGLDLLAYTKTVAPDKVAHVVGISQAAPVDGDIRSPQPDLWWDNGGGADMQVVEWQRKLGAALTPTHLLLVPDDSFRVRTRVTANFAGTGGEYRWRVWSVGVGGAMAISPWRRLVILP